MRTRAKDNTEVVRRRAHIGAPLLAAVLTVLSVSFTVATLGQPSTAEAADRVRLERDLAGASDFRLRVASALALGKLKNPQSAPALEKALGDPHPAVRAASAAALGKLGLKSSAKALEKALTKESSSSVRAQINKTLKKLTPDASVPAKFIVQIGDMKNRSNVGQNTLAKTLRAEAVSAAKQLPGAVVAKSDKTAKQEAAERKLPVLAIDGSITKLRRSEANGEVGYSANVEFIIKEMPTQALKGSVSGTAQALTSAAALNTPERVEQLQVDAVSAAVRSAMKRAPQAFEAAAK